MPGLIGARTALLALAASAAALAGACATAVDRQDAQIAGSDRQCFLPRQVSGFHAVDDDTVHVTVGANDVYELQIAGVCPEVDWSLQIGIRSTGGGSWVCRGYDAELLVPGPMGVDRCPVTAVRQLSEAEARALRDRRD